jgi:hypothetical protein
VGRDPVDEKCPGSGPDLAVDELQKRRLAGTAGADKKRKLTRLQGQMHVVESES